jgi:hypothetical protein
MDFNIKLNNFKGSAKEFSLVNEIDSLEDLETFNLRLKLDRPEEISGNSDINNLKSIFCQTEKDREKQMGIVKGRSFKVNRVNVGLGLTANSEIPQYKKELTHEVHKKFNLKAYLTRIVNFMLTKEEIKKVKCTYFK